jgi:hypothetical protein
LDGIKAHGIKIIITNISTVIEFVMYLKKISRIGLVGRVDFNSFVGIVDCNNFVGIVDCNNFLVVLTIDLHQFLSGLGWQFLIGGQGDDRLFVCKTMTKSFETNVEQKAGGIWKLSY